MRKKPLQTITDSEAVTHYAGATQCVNAALCGSNDDMEDADGEEVDCLACIAVIEHIYSHKRPNP